MKKYILSLTLLINTHITFAEQKISTKQNNTPTLRACLFHEQLYAVVQWTDICDITLVDGIFGMKHNSQEDNHFQLTNKDKGSPIDGSINKIDIPHNPECFTSVPYQQY